MKKDDQVNPIIAEAKARGFMDCRAIRDALGWDKPKPGGSYYSSMGVAYRWIEDAGEAVVYLIPDGATTVTKSERTGCFPPAFERVLAYKTAYYARLAHRDWESRRDAAQQIVDWYAKTDQPRESWLFDPDRAFDNVGPEPVWDEAALAVVGGAEGGDGGRQGRASGAGGRASPPGHAGIHRPYEQARHVS